VQGSAGGILNGAGNDQQHAAHDPIQNHPVTRIDEAVERPGEVNIGIEEGDRNDQTGQQRDDLAEQPSLIGVEFQSTGDPEPNQASHGERVYRNIERHRLRRNADAEAFLDEISQCERQPVQTDVQQPVEPQRTQVFPPNLASHALQTTC